MQRIDWSAHLLYGCGYNVITPIAFLASPHIECIFIAVLKNASERVVCCKPTEARSQ